ncbi:hypothetical protein OY671_008610, partial [Metschnikowia pulcherrima]
ERSLEILTQPVEASEADLASAGESSSRRDAIEIAAASVQAHRKAMPEPEESIDISTREGKPERGKEHHREGFDDIVWFRMDIGRRQNADPRWISPSSCRRGHITRNEVGAIRIAANETWFQIPRTSEARFVAAVKRTAREDAGDESGVTIESAAEPPRDTAHGDSATNAAMVSAKPAGTNPRASAAASVAESEKEPRVTSAEIAGPGFINSRSTDGAWSDESRSIAVAGAGYGRSTSGGGKVVNVEYVSANPTGPMHMGHCR